MEDRRNEKRPDAREAMTRHLIEAIEQVRLDMAKVELWAYAVSGFRGRCPPTSPDARCGFRPSRQRSSGTAKRDPRAGSEVDAA
jgi:hypothetical protein